MDNDQKSYNWFNSSRFTYNYYANRDTLNNFFNTFISDTIFDAYFMDVIPQVNSNNVLVRFMRNQENNDGISEHYIYGALNLIGNTNGINGTALITCGWPGINESHFEFIRIPKNTADGYRFYDYYCKDSIKNCFVMQASDSLIQVEAGMFNVVIIKNETLNVTEYWDFEYGLIKLERRMPQKDFYFEYSLSKIEKK